MKWRRLKLTPRASFPEPLIPLLATPWPFTSPSTTRRITATIARLSSGPQIVRLRPAPHCRTPILSYSLKVRPANHFINWQQDPQSNYLARLGLSGASQRAIRGSGSGCRDGGLQSVRFFSRVHAEQYPFSYEAAAARGIAALSGNGTGGAETVRIPCGSAYEEVSERSISWWPQSTRPTRNRICHSHGTRRTNFARKL